MTVSLAYRLTVLTMVFALSATSFGQSGPSDSAVAHEKIASRGIGKSIQVMEINGTTVTGTITAIDSDSFQVTPKRGAQAIRIRNDEVSKVKNGGLRTSVKVTIYVVAGFLLLGAIAGPRV
jgi:sRNA-binding regulator protein Hfq